MHRIPNYRVSLVKDGVYHTSLNVITHPSDAADLFRQIHTDLDREYFVMLMLDVKSKVIGHNVVSIGDLSSSIVHPREVFKPAILASAASIILLHNHPSGDATPSSEDVYITKRLKNCAEILGIELLDHIVIGDTEESSLRERGLF